MFYPRAMEEEEDQKKGQNLQDLIALALAYSEWDQLNKLRNDQSRLSPNDWLGDRSALIQMSPL